MDVNPTPDTGPPAPPGAVPMSHAGEGAKLLPVHSGKKFFRLTAVRRNYKPTKHLQMEYRGVPAIASPVSL